MKIYSKILLATLPLLLLAFAAAGGVTFFLSRGALTDIAEQWLETRSLEALAMVREQAEFLEAYNLEKVGASVIQAQADAAAGVSDIGIGEQGYVFIIDSAGRVVYVPDKSLSGLDVSAEPWFAQMVEAKAGRISYRIGGKRHLASFQYFEPWRWYVVATDPESEVYGAVNRLGSYVLALGTAGSLLIALVLMVLTRRVTAPLADLVQGAERVGRGELDTTIEVRTRDEVGILAKSFNEMTGQLRVLYDRLEERLTTVVSNAPIILFSLDHEGELTLLEGKGLATLNLTAETVIGRPLSAVFGGSPEILTAAETARGGETVSSVAILDQQIFEIWCAPLIAPNDSPAGAIGVATDVTERVKAQEKLARQAEYLAALNETTIGIISRLELDELLQAIITRAGQLMDAPHGFIYLVEDGESEIRRMVGVGVYEQSVGYRLRSGQGVAGRVWESGEPLVVNDYDRWDGRIPNVKYDGYVRQGNRSNDSKQGILFGRIV